MGCAPTAEFSKESFLRRIRLRANYKSVANALLDLVDFDSMLDVGCANGFLLEKMQAAGKRVAGVELSPDALEVLPETLKSQVTIADATRLGKIGCFDLVCCVEVAEHIPAERSAGLLNTLVANCKQWLYFTAATPCQPGHGHINLRSQFYWLNELRKRGMQLDWARTEALVDRIRGLQPAEWLEWNSLILRKGE